MSKITVKHYLNTYGKPTIIKGISYYYVYLLIVAKRKNVRVPSIEFSEMCTEIDFDEYLKLDNENYIFIQNERDTIQNIASIQLELFEKDFNFDTGLFAALYTLFNQYYISESSDLNRHLEYLYNQSENRQAVENYLLELEKIKNERTYKTTGIKSRSLISEWYEFIEGNLSILDKYKDVETISNYVKTKNILKDIDNLFYLKNEIQTKGVTFYEWFEPQYQSKALQSITEKQIPIQLDVLNKIIVLSFFEMLEISSKKYKKYLDLTKRYDVFYSTDIDFSKKILEIFKIILK